MESESYLINALIQYLYYLRGIPHISTLKRSATWQLPPLHYDFYHCNIQPSLIALAAASSTQIKVVRGCICAGCWAHSIIDPQYLLLPPVLLIIMVPTPVMQCIGTCLTWSLKSVNIERVQLAKVFMRVGEASELPCSLNPI